MRIERGVAAEREGAGEPTAELTATGGGRVAMEAFLETREMGVLGSEATGEEG